jgi:hypothetical protein
MISKMNGIDNTRNRSLSSIDETYKLADISVDIIEHWMRINRIPRMILYWRQVN